MEEMLLLPQAERRYREELSALRLWAQDNRKPKNWLLSPKGRTVKAMQSATFRGLLRGVDCNKTL